MLLRIILYLLLVHGLPSLRIGHVRLDMVVGQSWLLRMAKIDIKRNCVVNLKMVLCHRKGFAAIIRIQLHAEKN